MLNINIKQKYLGINNDKLIIDSPEFNDGYYEKCTFNNAMINMIKLQQGIYISCQFNDSTMQGARLEDSIYVNCEFINSDIYWCNTMDSNFIDCKFVKTSFRGACMHRTTFLNCDIIDCDFSNDNLGGSGHYEDILFINCNVKSILPAIIFSEFAQQGDAPEPATMVSPASQHHISRPGDL